MKNIKYKLTFGIALVCVMLFTTCNDVFDPPEIQTPVDYGRIRISFAGEEAARTVLPSTTFYQYTYTFIKADEQNGVIKAPGNDGFFSLEVGSYTVEVQAFTGNGETLAATGVSSAFNVGPGSNEPVEVVLTGVGAEAQGEFSYTITYPAGAAAEITLHKWPGLDTIALNPINVTQGNGKTQTLQLGTGSYLLTILVSKTGLYAGISEAIHIYPSLATAYTKNYVDNDFLPKVPGAAVSAPMLNGATQNSITINPVDPPNNGQAVEYGINTTNTAPSTWQSDLTFSGLSGGVYYLFARSAENYDYTAGAASASLQVIIVTTTEQWNTALTTIRNGGSGTSGNRKTYTVMVFGNVAVPGSTATSSSFGSVQYIAVTLKGSGTLSLNSQGSILRLGSNQILIIDSENLTLQGRSINSYAVMYVQNGGTLELKNGAISGNTSSANGGGVYLDGGAFTMSGGTISGNTVSGSSSPSGGGVYVVSPGSFTMTGGIVYGRDAGSPLANTGTTGAALYVRSGTARYGDASNILPHTDNYSSYTNNTIIPGAGGGSFVSDYTIDGMGTFTYDGSAKTVSVTRKENASPGAIIVLYNGTETLPVNVGTYTVTFNVAAASGFNAITGLPVGTITITRADGAEVNAPTGTSSVTNTSVTINAVTAPANGQIVEYARNTTNSAPSSGWQESTTFSSLTAGATYYIFARSKANTNYNAGTVSVSLQVIIVIVTFNANGGSGTIPSPIAAQAGSSITLPSGSSLTRTGYTFGGWNTNSSGTGTNYDAGFSYPPTGSITLYAKWLPNTAGITLDVEQIIDGAPIIADITISRTNNGYPVTYSVSVNAPDYDAGSITWQVAGVGAYAGQTVTGNSSSFTLNAAEVKYNSLGGHALTLTVTKGGMQYQRVIPFTIVQ